MSTRSSSLLAGTSVTSESLDRLFARGGSERPSAAYRLQFHAGFRFAQARELVGYLDALGISHIYSSPILKARAGSTHGYDITDHNQLNPEIGSEDEFRALSRELRARNIGFILDIVPNHVGIGEHNPWWQDVLANGRSSLYATYFDIDWEPLKAELRNKVLLPLLGGQYGEELESGNIRLLLENDRFCIGYHDRRFPIDLRSMHLLLDQNLLALRKRYSGAELTEWFDHAAGLSASLRELPPHSTRDRELAQDRRQRLPDLKRRLQDLFETQLGYELRKLILERTNGSSGTPHSYDALHFLLEAQPYRLAYWRVSAEEINYRRFFDINDLVGLNMEIPAVFAETHRLIRKLLADGLVQGLRIDHPDGLYNPRQYFARLQMLFAASQCCGAAASTPVGENGIELELQELFSRHEWMRRPPLYVLAEKILEPQEELPQEWLLDGTVGYEFANQVNGIFIAQENERAFTNLYQRFTGLSPDVETLIYTSKKLILSVSLSGELNVLVHLLEEISSHDRHARDFTRSNLSEALRETIACFPIYRTYIDQRGEITRRDRDYIQQAIAAAQRRNPGTSVAVYDFLRSVLLLERGGELDARRHDLAFTLKFQQLTGPVMAKGLEDTVCYVYNRFVALNEVGGRPDIFGSSLDEFHAANEKRAHQWPNQLLATSTHDTKRSEDVRARIDVLSEVPKLWSRFALRWRRLNQNKKQAISDGRLVPDHNEEYLLYQTLIGAAPWDLAEPRERDAFIARLQQYMGKAVHEAKTNLSWINQNPEYVAALETFIADILTPTRKKSRSLFLDDLAQLLRLTSYFGAINSLSQTVLKITAPGVPDIYQGSELWDFSLVDPDNRRPVDFDHRRRLLADLQHRTRSGDLRPLCADLLANFADGRIKLWTTMRTLQLRREHAELFRSGSYIPATVWGERARHLCSFVRMDAASRTAVLVAVPRLACTMMGSHIAPPLGDAWRETTLALPPGVIGDFQNVLTGEIVRPGASRTLLCREVFADFPVAVFISR